MIMLLLIEGVRIYVLLLLTIFVRYKVKKILLDVVAYSEGDGLWSA